MAQAFGAAKEVKEDVKSKAVRISLLLFTTKLFLVLLKYLFLNAQQQNATMLSQHVARQHAAEALVES